MRFIAAFDSNLLKSVFISFIFYLVVEFLSIEGLRMVKFEVKGFIAITKVFFTLYY